jgi:hypothetical protein
MNDRTPTQTRNHARQHAKDARALGSTRSLEGGGQVVTGPAFYIWEEDPRQARQWGAELADAWLSTRSRPL